MLYQYYSNNLGNGECAGGEAARTPPISHYLLIYAILLILAACGPAPISTGSPSTSPAPSSTATEQPPSETASPTGTPIPTNIIPSAPPTGTITNTPEIISFDIPLLDAEPVTAKRPPLYPIPWALSPYDHFYFASPVGADEVVWPPADYRYGTEGSEANGFHTGIDIPLIEGTPVLAAGPGTVVWAGWGLYSGIPGKKDDPYGRAVAIRHDYGYEDQPLFTIYAHLFEVDVTVGQRLQAGDLLGKVGDTGHATGPHLHFEVRIGANDIFSTHNPELWLVPPEGWGILTGRVTSTYGNPLFSQSVIVRSLQNKQVWVVKTYSASTVYSDPYYNENLVLSDLPEGKYMIQIIYNGYWYQKEIQVLAGQINYFTFSGYNKFKIVLPPTPGGGPFFTPVP